MSIELVTQDNETGLGIKLDQSCYMVNKVRFGSGISNRWGNEFASGQVNIACEDLCAVSDVVKLSTFHFVFLGRQGGPVPLKSLDTRLFVGTNDVDSPGFVLLGGSGMQFADLLYLLCELIPVLNVGMFPISTTMRLECGVLLKNARFGQEK
jgi:hypothetical protein